MYLLSTHLYKDTSVKNILTHFSGLELQSKVSTGRVSSVKVTFLNGALLSTVVDQLVDPISVGETEYSTELHSGQPHRSRPMLQWKAIHKNENGALINC